jgi:hypothetical protein
VTFYRGKGVLFRGPYTVHSRMDTSIAQLLQTRIDSIPKDAFLWEQRRHAGDIQDQLLATLRSVNPLYEQKSMRRGSLQALAATPTITEATIMEFSGHTNAKTLRRYLNWGKKSGEMQARTVAAALVLQPIAPHA